MKAVLSHLATLTWVRFPSIDENLPLTIPLLNPGLFLQAEEANCYLTQMGT